MATTSWDKFKLLLWKNWILQWNHKFQLIIELLIPVIFAALLVLVRSLVIPDAVDETEYKPQNISNLNLLSESLKNLTLPTEPKLEWKLAYTPDSIVLKEIVQMAATNLNCSIQAFPNGTAMQSYLMTKKVLAGIEFPQSYSSLNNTYPVNFEYALRFPSELRTANKSFQYYWLTNKLFPFLSIGGPRNPKFDDGGTPCGYIREGFIPIQNALSTAFIQLSSKSIQKPITNMPDVVMQRYPYPAYTDDPLLQGLESLVSLIILLSFIYPCTYTVKYITTEKEKQLKEVMKIMGLNNWIHWTAWFTKAFVMMGISVILIVIIIKIPWLKDPDVSVLTYTGWTVLFYFLIVYTIATITFCFMLATCFSKASTASAVTGLIWFITYIPFSFTSNDYENLSLQTKAGLSFISNTGMAYGFKLILQFEATGEGLQWNNLFKPISVDEKLTVGHISIILLLSSIIHMIICLYIEQISPGDFGVPQKWYFPFTRKFWRGGKVTDESYITNTDSNSNLHQIGFEEDPEHKRIGLQVKNLRKIFNNKVAVNGISLNMYEDEITVLLGHNGAGKTTTISMLTGMFPPTSGTAIINGSDIRTNIEGARMSLGICPQHNILFDDMTVKDHIVFYSKLKGLKGHAIDTEVEKYLRMLQLEPKTNVASCKLSGGMKRKLSIGAALCGGTKVVLCDEPSSGMDPAARRQLWDLLQAEKIGRTILLTTHFMDEADVLGDRIAIMCDGNLKCHGTSFYLKKKFGSGYQLICVKESDCDTNEVTKLLRKYIPDLTVASDIGAELSYQLPDQYSSKFEEMFANLEDFSTDLHLNGYGISITSLEEVFMNVGAEKNAVKNSKDRLNRHDETELAEYLDTNESMSNQDLFSDNTKLLEGVSLWQNQWKAMISKKYLNTLRNYILLIIQNFMPILFVVVTVLVTRTQASFRELQPLKMRLEDYGSPITILELNATEDTIEYNMSQQYESMLKSIHNNEIKSITDDFQNYILKLSETILVRINARYIAAATFSKGNIIAWLNNQPLHTAPLTLNLVHNAMAKTYLNSTYSIDVTNYPLPFTPQTRFEQLNTGNNLGTQLATNLCFCMSFVSAFYVLFLIKERESRAKLLQFVGGVKVMTFWFSQLLWDFLTYLITIIILVGTLACFQEEGYSSFSELGKVFLVFIIFGIAVIPFTYFMSNYFNEPATGFARLSIFNIFTGMALFIVIVVMSFEPLGTKDVADKLQWVFMIFSHFSLGQALNKLNQNVVTRNICKALCDLKPECTEDLLCFLEPSCCHVSYFGFTDPGILPETLYMIVTGLIFFAILLMKEFRIIEEIIFKIRKKAINQPTAPEEGYFDEDVANENTRIQNMTQSELELQNLVLNKVTKYYGKYLAVNQISVGIKHTECFGLLGVNGAGKTTTFKMMTGDERISSGNAYVKGNNLAGDMTKIYKEIGYCPQFDALLDDLTGRETLRIFCLLRGLKENEIKHVSNSLAKSFGFLRHIDKQTKTYSGGNKRKLSTAIAIIGSPSIIYLDEPTSGMDPAARRQLWNMVCKIRDFGKSIVLTSHSMEECEALCTRLAIMVNGEFKCIGSTQHLKNKFSKGIILKIKLRKNSEILLDIFADENAVKSKGSKIDDLKNFVVGEFPEAILQEEHQGILTFYIPLSSIRWSAIFGLMEHNRERLSIEDYSISQTTLEQIFLEFAKFQREDPREIK